MKQLNYNFAPDLGVAGGLYDLTGYVCDSFATPRKTACSSMAWVS